MKDASIKSLGKVFDKVFQNIKAETENHCCWIVDENITPDLLNALEPNLIELNNSLIAITNRFDVQKILQEKFSIDTAISDYDLSSLEIKTGVNSKKLDTIIYRISKEKALAHHCIHSALLKLNPGGKLIIIGEKNDGIKSISKNISAHYDREGNSKKHGNYYCVDFVKPESLTDERILQNPLPSQNYNQLREVTHNGHTFFSKPGVFGWNKIDQGSELLAQYILKNKHQFDSSSSILDLGCGWGYLTLITKEFDTEYRCATDNNVAAITAIQKNIESENMDVDIRLDDCGSQIDRRFRLIMCNPPFHSGFGVDESLTKKFLKQTSRLLNKRGTALFVVNQFIPIERLGEKYFSKITLVEQSKGFKIFSIQH